MKKEYGIIMTVAMIFSMSINISPVGMLEDKIIDNELFVTVDANTGQKTYNYVSSVDNGKYCTWDCFDDEMVCEMQNTLNQMNITGKKENGRSIIGIDNRVYTPPTIAPYCSVAYLRAYFDINGDGIADGSYEAGTGFLVSDKVLLTAAHCVVPREAGKTLVELKIYVGLDAEYQYQVNSATYIHPKTWTYNTNWTSNNSNYSDYDYCVIELWDSQTKPFYYNCISSSNISTPLNVFVSGYRGADPYWHIMTGTGEMSYSNYYICQYDNDTGPGVSGAPVYTNAYCVAIHTRGYSTYNEGNLITPVLYNWICEAISNNL